MRGRRNRESDQEAAVRVVFGLVGLVVLAYMVLPQGRAMVQGVFQLCLLLVGVAGAGAMGWAAWSIFRRRKLRVAAVTVVPGEFLPRARVVDFPPQAHEQSDLRYQPPPPVNLRGAAGGSGERARVMAVSCPPLARPNAARTTGGGPADLVEQLRGLDWFQFEKVTEAVYLSLGYEVSRRGGANPDGGIDLVIVKDGRRTAIQCKHWKAWKVGVKAIREFLGALTHAEIEAGIFITLEGYTEEAKALAAEHEIEILTDAGLARLLEQSGARYNPIIISALNDPRKFCPKCGAAMVLRTAAKGAEVGRQFWGCVKYPKCYGVIKIAGA